MITLKKLKWNNCFSYGFDNELNLNKDLITQILGTNGTGKSSIPLIIEEVLYNKNSRGAKKASIPKRYINKGYKIYLSWEKDGDLYEVTNDRTSKIKVELLKNGKDISSHTALNTYKTIQNIIGMDFKTFSQLVYQSTTASLQFLTATDTTRKKFLIDLLHLEEYILLYDVFRNKCKSQHIKTIQIEAKITTIQKWLDNNILRDTTLLPILKIEINTEKDEKNFLQLTQEIENISEKNKKIIQNNQYIKLLGQINLQEIPDPKIDLIISYDSLQTELGTINSNIYSAQKLIQKIENLRGQCPTCYQDIDKKLRDGLIELSEDNIESNTHEQNRLRKNIDIIKNKNTAFLHRNKLQREWEELYRSIDPKLPKKLLNIMELVAELDIVSIHLFNSRKTIKDTITENQRREHNNTRIEVIQEQTDAFTKELEELQAGLAKETELLSNLEVLKKAFSTNGLLAYKIENLVKELEELTNTYLAELSDGRFTIEFIINNDRLNVQITDNSAIIDILELSSGELARVNTSTLLAIRKLMSSISKSKINILFLDEIIGVLDAAGKEKLIEVLLKEKDLNTYIVSHEWKHPLLEKIQVVKRDNISKLEK